MSLGPDDLTPPGGVPTEVDVHRRLLKLEAEMREFKKGFSHHREVDFDDLEDRVDAHDRLLSDLKQLLISHQTTLINYQTASGLMLQSIDRSMKTIAEEMHAMRGSTTITTMTVAPGE